MNKITLEEIDRIYRIEYMPSSNWDMGYSRKIYVCCLDEKSDEIYRSMYVGDPLVPEYSRFNDEEDKDIVPIDGETDKQMVFQNNFEAYEIIDKLKKFKMENWNDYNYGCTVDGPNLDLAFFTKNNKNEEIIYRYLFLESSASEEMRDFFYKLFYIGNVDDLEYVSYNQEMMNKSKKLLPGGEIQEDKGQNHMELEEITQGIADLIIEKLVEFGYKDLNYQTLILSILITNGDCLEMAKWLRSLTTKPTMLEIQDKAMEISGNYGD